VVPVSGGFKPAELWELIRVHQRSSLFVAPTMLDRLVNYGQEHGVTDDNLKSIVVGGAPFYADDAKRAVSALGPRITQIYGQGESPMTISVLPSSVYADTAHACYERRIRSVGLPHSVVDLRIADEDGNPSMRGEIGEVLVRGDTVMSGYLGNPEATAATLRHGWLHTGDLGVIDVDGFLTLKGRSKELIISGGSNVYPREVEDVLLLNPGVIEAAVLGRPHPQWGEEVVAFVVPKAGGTVNAAELDQWCLQHIARFKRPKLYCIVDKLPHNAYGKVLKTVLLEQLDARPQQDTKP
jgi:long-chain acyl-CoA synthetase